MHEELESSQVALYLIATALIFISISLFVMHFEENRQAELESHFMGCRYLGKLAGPKSLYAFECGQNIVFKKL